VSFANPVFLWSLLGLAVPVAIHFLSRKEGKIIKLGSLRHVQETSTQQFRGIRLNEILLLMLRCACVIIFSFLLSGFYLPGRKGKWVLAERGTENIKSVQAALDSLEAQGYEFRNLTNNFPSSQVSDSPKVNYWSLIKKLEEQNLEDVIIFSFGKMKDFMGMQHAIPAHIQIIPVEPGERNFLVEAVQEGDSTNLRTGVSNSRITTFQSRKVRIAPDSIEVKQARQVKITLVHDRAHLHEKQILLAAVRALDKTVPISFLVQEAEPAQLSPAHPTGWLFWLKDENVPQTNAKILRWNPQLSDDLILQTGNNEWSLTQLLHRENAIEKKLTTALALLLTHDPALQNLATSNDQRTLPEAIAWSREGDKTLAALSPSTQNSFLIILFLLILAVERYLSFIKNQ